MAGRQTETFSSMQEATKKSKWSFSQRLCLLVVSAANSQKGMELPSGCMFQVSERSFLKQTESMTANKRLNQTRCQWCNDDWRTLNISVFFLGLRFCLNGWNIPIRHHGRCGLHRVVCCGLSPGLCSRILTVGLSLKYIILCSTAPTVFTTLNLTHLTWSD